MKYLLLIPVFTFLGYAICAQQTNSIGSQIQDRLNPVAHTKTINALSTSADGKWLASASSGDGAVIIWERTSGKMFRRLVLHKETIEQMHFINDNRTLILACNREIVFLNTSPGIVEKEISFQQPVSSFCLSALNDRLFVATGNPPFFCSLPIQPENF